MRLKQIIYLTILALGVVSCQELPLNFGERVVLARVGDNELLATDVASYIPKGMTGQDSVAYVDAYTQKWSRKQVKLMEAERIFSTSVHDIEVLVEEYRQSLLIGKLDQFYIGSDQAVDYSAERIAKYYSAHAADFKLDHPLVKGIFLRLPASYAQRAKLYEMMKTDAESKRKDLLSISQKSGFAFHEYRDGWVDVAKVLDLLPVAADYDYSSMLASRTMQKMTDADYIYYFRIIDYKPVGSALPLEQAEPIIKKILYTQHQNELLKSREEELYSKALKSGVVEYPQAEREN